MSRLCGFPFLLFLCFGVSSCIEFEREKLTYVHDEKKDELRVTLKYEGIFGNLDRENIHEKIVTMLRLMRFKPITN